MNVPFPTVTTSAKGRVAPQDETKLTMTELAMLVHELRTPILSILGFNAIAVNDENVARQEQARARIDVLGDHLLSLVNDILLTARAEQEEIVLDHVAVNAPRLLADVLSVVQPTAEAKRIKLDLTMSNNLPLDFMGDPVRLRQVLINLVSNAVTYSPTDTVVEIEAGLCTEMPVLYFCIRDQGPGMTAQEAESLFRPFRQIPRISGSQGSGLGLAICDRLIQAMGGSIDIQSVLGKGSSFTVSLPFAALSPEEDHPVTEPPVDAEMHERTFDILVVDDNELSNEIVSHVATKAGHRVTSVLSGPAALEFLGQHSVDLIILDQCMTGMDGLETARRIRGLAPGTAKPKIIGLTAHLTPDLIDSARLAGLDECFQKTMRPKDLIGIIEGIMAEA